MGPAEDEVIRIDVSPAPGSIIHNADLSCLSGIGGEIPSHAMHGLVVSTGSV